ncbi:MAG: DUF5916 domain-containing protein [Gemmatimonadota bacterium]
MRSVSVLFIVMTLTPMTLWAQEEIPVTKAREAIVLDGNVTEAAWSGAAPLEMVTLSPIAGNRPSHASELQLLYDDQFLYAAARFLVGEPSDIRGYSLQRDRIAADDWFRLMLDTFNDSENGLGFLTTPRGIRVDMSISQDGESVNPSWNGFWDVATTSDDQGWYAELRIPLSTLRFQSKDGRVVMGLIAGRYSASNNETSSFPAMSPDLANPLSRASAAAKIVLEGIDSGAEKHLTPYVLTGLDRNAVLDPTSGSFGHQNDSDLEAGFDLKYGLTSNLTVDLTLNTDFAQVEADNQQVNLTRFSLFFPEKRQFFQEQSGIFAVPTGALQDNSNFFHSRRIGLTDSGEALRIFGGARLSGRIGTWDVGALSMHTDTRTPGVSENYGVFRVRRRILNEQSTVGTIATTRLDTDGNTNVAYAVDTRLRVTSTDYLTAQWGQSFDSNRNEANLNSGLARVLWERPGTLTSRGLAYRVGAKWSGPEFDPGIGFQTRSDFSHLLVNVRYGFYPGEGSAFRSIQPSPNYSVFLRNEDGTIESSFLAMFLNFEMKSGVFGYLGVSRRIEDLTEPLPFSPEAVVPIGRHAFNSAELAIHPSAGSRFGVGGAVQVGEFYDGTQFGLSVAPELSVNEHLEVSAEYNLSRVKFADRQQEFNADIARLRAQVSVDTHLSVNAFIQYNQAADLVGSNVRLRYHFAEGKDLFVVYNNVLNTDLRRDPSLALPRSQSQTLLVKYTYTW